MSVMTMPPPPCCSVGTAAAGAERGASGGSSCLEWEPLLLRLRLRGEEELLVLFLLLTSSLLSTRARLLVFLRTCRRSSYSSLSWGAVSKPVERLSKRLFLLVRLLRPGKTSGAAPWEAEWELLLEGHGLSTLSLVSLRARA